MSCPMKPVWNWYFTAATVGLNVDYKSRATFFTSSGAVSIQLDLRFIRMLSLKRISFRWLSCTNRGHMNTKQRYPHLSLFSAHRSLTFTLRGDGQCVPSSLKPLLPIAYFLGVHSHGFTHCLVNVWLGEFIVNNQCSEWALVYSGCK